PRLRHFFRRHRPRVRIGHGGGVEDPYLSQNTTYISDTIRLRFEICDGQTAEGEWTAPTELPVNLSSHRFRHATYVVGSKTACFCGCERRRPTVTSIPRNLLTDILGIRVGHAGHARAASGVTVILFDQPFVTAVDVRGGGPGTRET